MAENQPEDLARLVPDITTKIAEIKKQSRLRQGIGAAALFGSAGVAVWLGPTTAIVVAALLVSAVWLLPPARRRLLGEGVVLRDGNGTARLVVSLSDAGAPLIAMADDQGRSRLGLLLGSDGEPMLLMFDADGNARFFAGCVHGGVPNLALLDSNQVARISGTLVGEERPSFTLQDADGVSQVGVLMNTGTEPGIFLGHPGTGQVKTMITKSGVSCTHDDRMAMVGMAPDGAALVAASAGKQFAGISANEGVSALTVQADAHWLEARATGISLDGLPHTDGQNS